MIDSMHQTECRTAGQYQAVVVSQRELAAHTYAVRVRCPELAQALRPGQFFMIRPAGGTDPLLGRPFAVYDIVSDGAHAEKNCLEFAYHTIGKMTGLMSHWSGGEPVELWGPLGNGFPLPQVQHLLCVGGGIGYTPFLAVAKEAAGVQQYGQPARTLTPPCRKISFCYGVQTKSLRADLSDFSDIPGLEIHLATDDGSEGHRGFVTDLVEKLIHPGSLDRPGAGYCCGPEPMMHAVARLCSKYAVPCWLSLETPMACGFGACFSCVTKVRTGAGDSDWDYRRTCIEGPIFPAEMLVF
jgi:dihydroorotate dehydrogenase electron transfer subunit